MTFAQRARNYWACVSILFNQTIHFGAAPYPLTFSETCYLRCGQWQYACGMFVVDSLFALFGEYDHCKKAYIQGQQDRGFYS